MINIQIQVDAATLAKNAQLHKKFAGTLDKPTNLGSWNESDVYISMTTQHSNVTYDSKKQATEGQGHSELAVKANSNDTLSWTINTFDNNTDYTVYLYNGVFNPQDKNPEPAITPLTYISAEVLNYLPPSGNPTADPKPHNKQVASAQATVLRLGVTIQYVLSFIVVDNSTAEIVGYFSWDPFINVAAPKKS